MMSKINVEEFVKSTPRKRKRPDTNGVVMFIVGGISIALICIVALVYDWTSKNEIKTESLFTKGEHRLIMSTRPVWTEVRKPKEVLSPLAKEIIAPTADALTPIERKIVDKWGERYGYIALAVFRCESGLRPEAVNWSSKDVGIAQINWPIWEKPIKEKFGYTLVDMFDVDKNLEVAYWISDRDLDGKDINLEPWVVFNNGTFRGCIK
jgi:hypothetical protein